MTTKSNAPLDAELQRALEIATEMTPVSNELQQMQLQQNQTSWPWQVRQAPSYTSDHIPVNAPLPL